MSAKPAPSASAIAAVSAGVSAKEAKAAAKAAKVAKRAAAKSLQSGERQAQNKSSHAIQQGQQQCQPDLRSADSDLNVHPNTSAPAASGSAAAAPMPTATATSLASCNAKLLQPAADTSPSKSAAKSTHGIISTVHPPLSSAFHRTQLLITSLSRGLHPSVILLQQHLASHALLGSSARAIATLAALRDFIVDYKTPKEAVLNRDMVVKLGHQISGITSARPLGSSAGNAVRFLKYEISVIAAEIGEEEVGCWRIFLALQRS